MRTAHILLISAVAAALVSMVVCHSGPSPDECCFQYYPNRINKKLITSYYMTDQRCAKPAAILVTKRSHRVCVNPSEPWVAKIMKYLDEKNF